MNERNTPACDIQTPESPREAKASCTARQHSLWQQIHDHSIPKKFELTGPENAVYSYLANRCGMNSSWSWPVSETKIADETRFGRRTVQRTIKRLSALGLIQVDAGRGRGHIHRYTFPADLAAIPTPAPKNNEKAPGRRPLTDTQPGAEKASERRPLAEKGVTVALEKASQRRTAVKVVDLTTEGGIDIDPSLPQLSADEINFNREMLNHPEIAASDAQAGEIAPNYPAPVVFAVLNQFLHDQAAGQNITNRVLKTRFEHPDDFPRPKPRACPGSNFYHDFKWTVPNFDTAPRPEANTFDEHQEPLDTPAETPTESAVMEAGSAALTLAPAAAVGGSTPTTEAEARPVDQKQLTNERAEYLEIESKMQLALITDNHDLKDEAQERMKRLRATANEPASPHSEPLRAETTPTTPQADESAPRTPPEDADDDHPQPDERLLIRLRQLTDNQPWPGPKQTQRRLDTEIARITANTSAPLARTRERLNNAVYQIIREIEHGETPSHEPRRRENLA